MNKLARLAGSARQRLRGPRLVHRGVERGFVVLGSVLLGFCGLTYARAELYQARQACTFEATIEEGRERQRANATRAAVQGGGVVGRIEVRRLGVSAMIAEGVDRRTLNLAVGHVPGTAFPGEPGNVAVSGHRDTFFRALRDIAVQDTVHVRTLDGTFVYCVDSTAVVTPDRTEVLAPTEIPTLTLITCYPFGYVGPAPKRFIVRARQVAAMEWVSADSSLGAAVPRHPSTGRENGP